ncbi:MAG: transcriptional repressor [Desulfomonile tiedjei]|uniref:Transcriptional repressor n=1 Tax=Desulfomonile tiedjei TaxID=2358 RepID=A0A9D6V8D8_9BACT|nr:transcriptional repressor [Desulfomonile tiedjei]
MNSLHPLRMTQQRRVILDELRNLTSHPTADELHLLVRKRLPKISISTLYRNLEILSASGLVRKMDVAGQRKRFDATTSKHYHIRCDKCGRVDDVHMDLIPTIEEIARSACRYESVSHRVEFTGICPHCAEDEPFERRDEL